MAKTKLIVLEGFDRTGKDSLLIDLKLKLLNLNVYIYTPDISGFPKYSEDKLKYVEYLNKFVQNLVKDLYELSKKYETIIMTRLIVSDNVYSTLFDREQTVSKYINQIIEFADIFNYIMLFDSYLEYLDRLRIINEEIEYDEDNFNKINLLYYDIASLLKKENNIDYKDFKVYANNTKETIYDSFILHFNL